MSNLIVKPIAIHLPQFHPFKENDEWWGKGFTEWTNVTKAQPLYPGHYQPQLPTDLGFYDLRLPEARQAQADLAQQYGIYGFCYYHYWFNGKLLMETPLQQILESQKPDMPFMLCWANDNWTRKWDGLYNDILMEQTYSDKDDEDHINYLLQFLKDPRYIKVDGKPVIIIYKSFLIPNPQKTVQTWRKIAKEHNIELYLCHMLFSYRENNKLEIGFDAAIDFEPFGIRRNNNVFQEIESNRLKLKKLKFAKRVLRKLHIVKETDPLSKFNILNYEYCYENLHSLSSFNYKIFPSIVPGWDNTARNNKNPTLIYSGSTPEKFQKWLRKILLDFKPYTENENFVFINAWNEWAEGNHLEPCRQWGHAYLEALHRELSQINLQSDVVVTSI